MKKLCISSGKISAVHSLSAPSGSIFSHWPDFLMHVKHTLENNLLAMSVWILSHAQILTVVLGLRAPRNWLRLICQKRHVTNERPPPTVWGSAPTAAGAMHPVAVEQVSAAGSCSTRLGMLQTGDAAMKGAFGKVPTDSLSLLKWLRRIQQWRSLDTEPMRCPSQ